MTQVDGVTYGWDNNGNLTSDGQRTFTYDSANRLTSVVGGGATTQFTYNGDGDRLAQIVAGVTTKYALDPTGLAQVLIETTSGQSTHYLPGLAQYGSNAWSYYLPDRLGSVRQLTDHSGTVTLARSYDPFGNGLEQVGAGQSTFGYTGEQMDPTGLVFLRARYYSPGVGRFLTADSVVPDPLRSGGWNRYAYVNNNSVNYIDPSGQRPPCGGLGSSNECDESRYYAGFTVGRPYALPGYHDAIREAMDPRHFLDPIFNHIVGGLVTVPIGDLAGHLVGLHPPVIQGLNPRTSAYWDAFGDPGPTGLNWNGIRYAHSIGVSRGQTAASEDGFTPSGWQNPFANRGNYGQGFDDICFGPTGDPVIIEYKGGVNPRLSRGQMETRWVQNNIQRLIDEGNPMGFRLRAALNNGTLTGAAYLTPIRGTVPQQTQRIYFTYP